MKKNSTFRGNALPPVWNGVITAGLLIIALITLMPVLLIIVVSFSSGQSIAENGYTLFPQSLSLEAYKAVMKTGRQVLMSYRVTIAHTVVGSLASIFVMSMYAYVLAHKQFKLRQPLMFLTFFTMLFSGGLVPSYIVNVRYLHLYDNFLIFVLPTLVSAYNVIILRTFVNTTIPDTMLEAARIDGAGEFRIYWQIVLPLFKPALATVLLFNVVSRWNDWFTGMLYIDNADLVPLQTMLQRIQQSIDFIKQNVGKEGYNPQMQEALRNLPTESVRMAITIVSTLPVMLVYPFFQRHFIKGLTIGSVKG